MTRIRTCRPRGGRSGGVWVAGLVVLAGNLPAQAVPPVPPPVVAGRQPPPPTGIQCEVDLTGPGRMEDILANVLVRAEHRSGSEVHAFLAEVRGVCSTGDQLLDAAANRWKIEKKRLARTVDQWRHINCEHAAIAGYVVPDFAREESRPELASALPVSGFAADVTMHVVLHELGHAVIREFDLMVLGNEETMADAFATHLLIEHFPDCAVRAIHARVTSLLIEASEVPRDQWSVRGEHDSDARRAFQIAALAVAADKVKFAAMARLVDMSERDIRSACDYGADIHRAWRRTLSPLMMPSGKSSTEFRFVCERSVRAFVDAGEPSLAAVIQSALQRFDWHSQIGVEFVVGEGGAAWSRSKRTVTVHSEYLQRFIAQGLLAEAGLLPAVDVRR